MRQAIRALGWVTKILWVILLATIITIAYSATQISVSVGEARTTATEQAITISFPVNITNNGLYALTQLNVTTKVTDQNSQTLANGTTIDQSVQKGTSATITYNITINIPEIIAQTNGSLLFNDTTFTVFQYVSLDYANAIPFSLHANYTMPWGAPLSNLTVGNPTFQLYNSTYSNATVQLQFENHNQYLPVNGTMRVEIYNSRQMLKGAGAASIDVQPNTSCDTQVDFLVRNFRTTTPSGEIYVFFETSAFDYGPVVISFG